MKNKHYSVYLCKSFVTISICCKKTFSNRMLVGKGNKCRRFFDLLPNLFIHRWYVRAADLFLYIGFADGLRSRARARHLIGARSWASFVIFRTNLNLARHTTTPERTRKALLGLFNRRHRI